MYTAWGDLVVSDLCQKLEGTGKDLDSHLKQPAKARVKSDDSLIDKAFYRPHKNYENPYEDIEDKVGCRFVVLLVEHIDELSEIIKSNEKWEYVECRHFSEERKKSPTALYLPIRSLCSQSKSGYSIQRRDSKSRNAL
ncbi:hypothetical protein LB044_003309 [Vibrio fluvialis]|nr:hypothetical protein [Vibrio fluvialis]